MTVLRTFRSVAGWRASRHELLGRSGSWHPRWYPRGAAGGFLFRGLAPTLGLMSRNAERQMQMAGLDCATRAWGYYAGHAALGGLGGGVGAGIGHYINGG